MSDPSPGLSTAALNGMLAELEAQRALLGTRAVNGAGDLALVRDQLGEAVRQRDDAFRVRDDAVALIDKLIIENEALKAAAAEGADESITPPPA